MNISDERLGELIKLWSDTAGETVHILRELRDYRKAVREYLSAMDVASKASYKLTVEEASAWQAAEATLRALQER